MTANSSEQRQPIVAGVIPADAPTSGVRQGSRRLALGALEDGLEAAARGEARVVVVRGEPGIGKTWVCDRLARSAVAAGFLVLRCGGREADVTLSFAGLFDVLGPLVADIDALPPPQRAACRGALRLDDVAVASDRLAVAAGCLGVLSARAKRQPVCVVVDDAHWLDEESLGALAFAARRLQADAVLVVFASRQVDRRELAGDDFLELSLTGLDVEEAGRMLAAACGVAPSLSVTRALVTATGGNPLALREAARSLTPLQLQGSEPLPEVLVAPTSIVEAFAHRLGALPPSTQEALVVLAADERADHAVLQGAMATLGIQPGDLDGAERAGMVDLSALVARFRHPLIRSVVYHGSTSQQRRVAHGALATSWSERGDDDRSTWHRLHAAAGPDPALVEPLTEMGQRARARGAHRFAADAFERAAGHVGDGPRRDRLLLDAAVEFSACEREAQHVQRCLDAIDPARLSLHERAQAALLRGAALLAQGDLAAAERVYVDAARAIGTQDPCLAATLFCEGGYTAGARGSAARSVDYAEEVLVLAEGAPEVLDVGGRLLAPAFVLSGDVERGRRFSRRFLAGVNPLSIDAYMAAMCAVWVEDYGRAAELVGEFLKRSDERGLLSGIPPMLAARGELQLRTGHPLRSHTSALESVELGREFGQAPVHGLGVLALAQAALGTLSSDLVDRLKGGESGRAGVMYVLAAEGSALLGAGDIDAAVTALRAVATEAAAHGAVEPNLMRWSADFVESHLAAGRTTEAIAELDRFERLGRELDRRWPQAAALRCRGLLASGAEIDTAFAAAMVAHRRVACRVEAARTELAWGRRLVEVGRAVEAGAHLRRALATFDEAGAAAWAARADETLRATGARKTARPSLPASELTSAEAQVAALVAEGLSNREVAARLFVSEKTVEFHLTRVFRKLDIKRRSQLAALFRPR